MIMPLWLQHMTHQSFALRIRIAATAASAAIAGALLGGSIVTAQDGTSGAPPLEETACVLVPASPMEAILSGTAATPGASPAADAGATPVAVGATPVATSVAESNGFNEELLLEDLTAAATSLASCLTEDRYSDVADRTSPLFRGQLIGIAEPVPADLFGSLLSTFPETTYSIVEIGEPTVVDPTGVATAEIIWRVGHQVRVDQWAFLREEVQGVPTWVVDRAAPGSLDPAIDAEVVEVIIADNQYAIARDSVDGDAIRFEATNTDDAAHELLVLRLEGDVNTSQLLTTPGPSLPEGFEFIGQETIPANASGRLLLSDLEPGRYAIVDLLPGENGVPHLADGMEVTFEVE